MNLPIFKDRTILITGGTGSFGRAFAKKILEESQPTKVIIFSRDEWKQSEMQHEEAVFSSSKIRYFLGDVRDKERLERAFQDVDFVVHAAALKQVPAAEYNPSECIKTNVQGAMNVVDAAIRAGVEKVIALSTDKAVNPVNLYGATKLCQEKLFASAHHYVGARGYPTFSVVRYGNVANSRGSVIPHWKKLIEKGIKKIPVTDPTMTRYWITIEEAVDLVIRAISEGLGGEIFIPKLPSFTLEDLFWAINPGDLTIELVGIREGEKRHELLISADEARNCLEFSDYYLMLPDRIIESESQISRYKAHPPPKRLPSNFVYDSGTNVCHLSKEELKRRLR